LIILFSFTRVFLYPFYEIARDNLDVLPAALLGFILVHPYPLLAYAAYGFFGAMIGILIHENRPKLLRRLILPAGLSFLLYGLIGMSRFELSVAQPDYFWYFKTTFELGFFLLLILLLISIHWDPKFLKNFAPLKWFSRVSLSVFLLETTVSEIMRQIWLAISSHWVGSIPACVLFGLVNLMFWTLILYFWQKSGFKYSFEYFWVKGLRWMGKDSTKLEISVNQ
jgi:peptidoglycan/LPS O-acetylase OafA/YrhL